MNTKDCTFIEPQDFNKEFKMEINPSTKASRELVTIEVGALKRNDNKALALLLMDKMDNDYTVIIMSTNKKPKKKVFSMPRDISEKNIKSYLATSLETRESCMIKAMSMLAMFD